MESSRVNNSPKPPQSHITDFASPARFLLPMIIFMVLIVGIIFILLESIINIFFANPALNSLIIAVLVIGILFNVRRVISLSPEVAWIRGFHPGASSLSIQKPPRLLASMASIMNSKKGKLTLNATSMRNLLDCIDTRLMESRETSRYLTGLLVFLGLLGTFWGLLETITSVTQAIRSLSATSDDFNQLISQLQSDLEAPLKGMSLAFSSSLLGLAGSLILGFLDLQSGHAQNQFYNDLEEWLSSFTRITSAFESEDSENNKSVPAYAYALLEQSAESLDKIQRSLNSSENLQYNKLIEQAFKNLSSQISLMNENTNREISLVKRLTEHINNIETKNYDASIINYLRKIDINLVNISENLSENNKSLMQEVRNEIKLLARTIVKVNSFND